MHFSVVLRTRPCVLLGAKVPGNNEEMCRNGHTMKKKKKKKGLLLLTIL